MHERVGALHLTWWGGPIFRGLKNIIISQVIGRFKKKQLGAIIIGWHGYKCRRFVEFGAFWATIWYFVIFGAEIFHHFL